MGDLWVDMNCIRKVYQFPMSYLGGSHWWTECAIYYQPGLIYGWDCMHDASYDAMKEYLPSFADRYLVRFARSSDGSKPLKSNSCSEPCVFFVFEFWVCVWVVVCVYDVRWLLLPHQCITHYHFHRICLYVYKCVNIWICVVGENVFAARNTMMRVATTITLKFYIYTA